MVEKEKQIRCMAKSKISKKILEISEGLLASLTDVILVFLNFGYEMLTDPRFGRSLPYTLGKMDMRMQKINYFTIKRAVSYARQKGWIKEDLEVTEEGQKRLKNIFPEDPTPSHWDGNWYLVNFDIPEKLRRKRDILRENLISLGFGKLQNSIWICPYNFLGDIEKIVKDLDLTPYVILAISNRVGQEASKILAERIWKISEVQREYQKFIIDFENKENLLPWEVFFRYHAILKMDPRLPKELYPDNWLGEEAYQLYLKIVKKKLKPPLHKF